MRLRKPKTPLPPDLQASQALANQLREAGRVLTGWTVRGTGLERDVDYLLDDAAREIERLIAAVTASGPPTGEKNI